MVMLKYLVWQNWMTIIGGPEVVMEVVMGIFIQ
jgi:hypothetical protein